MKKPSIQRKTRPADKQPGGAAQRDPSPPRVGRADDHFEAEAHRIESALARGSAEGAGASDWASAARGMHAEGPTIRRAPKTKAQAPEPGASSADKAAPPAATAAAAAPAGLLTEDDAATSRGQMRKSEFLDMLRGDICAAVDGALAGSGRDSQGCPWIDHWLDYYRARSASQVETSLQRYAPEARGAGSAAAYARLISARVYRSAQAWERSGELPDLPQEIPESPMAGGGMLSAFGGMFFKARPGGPHAAENPGQVQEQLGSGRPLPTTLRTRMEPAFGTSFLDVRVHTDATGSRLSDQLNARAFTVGRHVAFGPGEFRPGTLAGDALIAHELAHVVQQNGGNAAVSNGGDSGALERDADRAAEGAVLSSLGPGATRQGAQLRTGLRLQRCSKDNTKDPSKDPKLLQGFAATFSDAAKLIRKSPEGLKLVVEAQLAGVEFGGYAEEGPGKGPWPYTNGNKVYVPKMRTDPIVAMSDFLFELNNAIRAPKFSALQTEAIKGSGGTLTAREYARKTVEQEVEGMLRMGSIWFEMKKSAPGTSWDKYDSDFFLAQYNAFQAKTKTKEDIVKDVLQWMNGLEKSKTNEQFYMDQYTGLSGGK